MQIRNFINDRSEVEKWLADAARSLADIGYYSSHWFHGAGPGFGLVIVAERSGEFHLMANGDVISHVEEFNRKTQEFDLVEAVQRPTSQFHEFEQLYQSFKRLVTSNA